MGTSLDVIVTGGGICGLSCAIALARAGHQVTVYEKYPATAESGAGIVCPSNASRILVRWGIDLDAAGMLRYSKGEIRDGKTLQIIQAMDAAKDAERDGGWQVNTTRKDLRAALLGVVEAEVARGRHIVLRYEAEVVDYDEKKPAVQLKDGSWLEADLVVACDGIKSKASHRVVGFDNPATPTGLSAFRLVIPRERLKKSELLRETLDSHKDRGTVWFAIEHPGKIFVWWNCHFGEIEAFDIVIRDNEKYASTEEWLARCDKSILLKEFEHWHPVFREVLIHADEDPQLWKICSREPLDTLFKGRLCIMGDALHPMLPNRGQGGAQSIEDAAVLGEVMTDIESVTEVDARLRLLQDLRVPRYATAQLASQVQQDDPHMEETAKKVHEKCRKFFQPEDQKHLENRATERDWLNQYDAVVEAQKALARMLQVNGR